MKLHKKLMQCQFTIGCIGDENSIGTNNDNYEQYARITLWKLGSNTYKVTVEEFDSSFGDMINELDVYEEFICGKKKAYIIWNNLFYKYAELEEVYKSNCY